MIKQRLRTVFRQSSGGEDGIAMVAAILLIVLIAAVVTMFLNMAMTDTKSHRLDGDRARSLPWAEAAIQDVRTKLEMRTAGQHLSYPGHPSNTFMQTWKVLNDGPIQTCTNTNSDTTGCYGLTNFWTNKKLRARDPKGAYKWGFRIKIQDDSGKYVWGWYQLKHQNAYNWIHYNYRPSSKNPLDGGQVYATVRGWMESSTPAPRMVHYTLQKHSMTRWAILTDEHLDIGDATVIGSTHSNDSDLPVGQQDGNVVPFDSIDQMFNTVDTIADTGDPYYCGDPNDVVVCQITRTYSVAPSKIQVYHVQLNTNGCIKYWPAYVESTAHQWSGNAGTTPIMDDRYPDKPLSIGATVLCTPSFGTSGRLPNSSSGAIYMFPTTVIVEGTSGKSLTIMARSKVESTPASIAVIKNSTSTPYFFGAYDGDTINPLSNLPQGQQRGVGLVAQDSIYVPRWSMPPPGETFRMDYVGLVAHGGALQLGPTMRAAAGSKNPCDQFINQDGLYGSLYVKGLVMSRRSPTLQYASSAQDNPCKIGFDQRTYEWYSSLQSDPPPMFPSDGGWSIADVNVDYGMDRYDLCSPKPGVVFIPQLSSTCPPGAN